MVEGRRALLQRCLQDTLASADPRALHALAQFLPPPDEDPCPGATCVDAASLAVARSPAQRPTAPVAVHEPGARISLITDPPPARTEAELLRVQHGRCAGCRAPIAPDLLARGGILGGWNPSQKKVGTRYACLFVSHMHRHALECSHGVCHDLVPQPHARCSYTGLLYCPRCHTGQSAVLPAAVLHAWDFGKQPVCSLAAEYLASIQDKPLLCVGAVNPGLHARVPTLAKAHDLRVRAYKALAAAQDKVGLGKVFVSCACNGVYNA